MPCRAAMVIIFIKTFAYRCLSVSTRDQVGGLHRRVGVQTHTAHTRFV